jgi:hypothetical protein
MDMRIDERGQKRQLFGVDDHIFFTFDPMDTRKLRPLGRG